MRDASKARRVVLKNTESMLIAARNLENAFRDKLSLSQRQQFVGWMEEGSKWTNLMDSNVFDTATRERFRTKPQLLMAVTIGVALMGLGHQEQYAFRNVASLALD